MYSSAAKVGRELKLVSIHLKWNLRNTRAVHDAAYRFYTGREVSCRGPDGEPPIPVTVKGPNELKSTVGRLVSRLVNEEAMEPDEIAIIVPDESWIPGVASNGMIAGLPITDAGQPRAGCVTLDTVRRFKGLESCIIVIVVDERFSRSDELCYVSLSRGRTRAYLVGPDEHIRALAKK